jgi:hypothetical protein
VFSKAEWLALAGFLADCTELTLIRAAASLHVPAGGCRPGINGSVRSGQESAHRVPFQCKASVLPNAVPTAQALFGDCALTQLRAPRPIPKLGLATMAQVRGANFVTVSPNLTGPPFTPVLAIVLRADPG